jgi:hypothetical protein
MFIHALALNLKNLWLRQRLLPLRPDRASV